MAEYPILETKDIPLRRAVSRAFPVVVASSAAGVATGFAVGRKVQKMTTMSWVVVGLLGGFLCLSYYVGTKRGKAATEAVGGSEPLPGKPAAIQKHGPAQKSNHQPAHSQQSTGSVDVRQDEIPNLFGGYLGEN